MRNPVLAIAIVFALVASYTVAFAQAFESHMTFQGTKSGKDKGNDPPPPPPPTKAGTVKPVGPTVNPALQGNVLQKSGGTGSPGGNLGYDLKGSKGSR
jgi:hypothetical protein